jgi:formylglycine-generating enzyme required for sulfatase activity
LIKRVIFSLHTGVVENRTGQLFKIKNVVVLLSLLLVLLIATSSAIGFSVAATVPDGSYSIIPANPSFQFAVDLNNKAPGETSAITSDYCLSKYLVTNAQFKQFLDATNSKKYPSYWSNGTYPEGKGNHPVLSVSLNNAQSYCAWLETQNPQWHFRLPTEAELENEAVGSSHLQYPWGNPSGSSYDLNTEQLTSKCNYNGVVAAYCLKNYGSTLVTYNNPQSTLYSTKVRLDTILSISSSGVVSGWVDHTTYTGFLYTDLYDQISAQGGYTSDVGAYPVGASEHGCYDMGGDAWSWSSSLIVATNGAESGETVNAVRGGSWYATLSSCKSTYRGEGRQASGGYATVGFRVVASPVATDPTATSTINPTGTPTIPELNNWAITSILVVVLVSALLLSKRNHAKG